jgi:hypothetical protein
MVSPPCVCVVQFWSDCYGTYHTWSVLYSLSQMNFAFILIDVYIISHLLMYVLYSVGQTVLVHITRVLPCIVTVRRLCLYSGRGLSWSVLYSLSQMNRAFI